MTAIEAPARRGVPAAVDARRWIRRRRIAVEGRADIGTVYAATLALLMAVALLGQPLVRVVWPPDAPDGDPALTPFLGAVAVSAAFVVVLRQLGPLSVSRSDATWLLPAPLPRRTLLAPALTLTTVAALVVGAVTGIAVTGHVAARPAGLLVLGAGAITGAAAAVLATLLALACQRRPSLARLADGIGIAIGAGCLVLAAALRTTGDHRLPSPLIPPVAVLATGAAALAVGLIAIVLTWRALENWPTAPIAEASINAGAYADVVYAVEPSYLTEMSARRFWRSRTRIRTTRLLTARRVPPLIAQDLIILRRKAARLWWPLGAAAVPVYLANGPAWLLLGVVLIGALAAAGLTAESTHGDASNPAMLRLLGVTGRQMTAQRLVVPAVVAGVWLTVTLAALQAAGSLAGPWWALGLLAGPAVAVGAFQRAKASAASIGTILVDTPLGAFPAGMLLWLLNGIDVLAVLTLPVSAGLVTLQAPEALGWHWLLAQAVVSALGCALLVRTSGAAAGSL
ncbi:hypothetical protein GA0070610_5160 [Micromonospora echinofusca]|uniref:ABC-2 type transport system permease protein n=1 Tax=Micromonospora echinofusca TaxID=47858 RepID=A0A1C5GG55_MICEH|nr:DUF6297 family protein [Micromonospora echinofusca]SCG18809.1 hypothetical protein GA0070610_5160 [Micromonospora echinofusca]